MQGQTGLTPFLCSLRSRFNSWPTTHEDARIAAVFGD
jgi:hypothetical protein